MLSPAPDVPVRAGAREWAALVVLMLPVLLISVDNTVLNFALPEISRELRPTGTQLLWMVDAYPLVLAGLLVPMGALGDRVGRRRLLLVGSTGFAAVSALAALAPTGEALVAARAAPVVAKVGTASTSRQARRGRMELGIVSTGMYRQGAM